MQNHRSSGIQAQRARPRERPCPRILLPASAHPRIIFVTQTPPFGRVPSFARSRKPRTHPKGGESEQSEDKTRSCASRPPGGNKELRCLTPTCPVEGGGLRKRAIYGWKLANRPDECQFRFVRSLSCSYVIPVPVINPGWQSLAFSPRHSGKGACVVIQKNVIPAYREFSFFPFQAYTYPKTDGIAQAGSRTSPLLQAGRRPFVGAARAADYCSG